VTRSRSSRLPQMFLLSSRVLLLTIAGLLLVLPWSEYYCAFDNFPNGQDVETNLLACLALLGLMLLFIQISRQGLSALISLRSAILVLKIQEPRLCRPLSGIHASLAHRIPLPRHLAAACSLPLQI
jgi:polyferredoxin